MSIKESYASCAGQPSGDTPNGVRPRKAARSRGAHSNKAPRKLQKAGEEEDMKAESEDLALQVQAKLTIKFDVGQVANEGYRDFDVLHGAPPKLERHRKRGARLRKGLQRHGGNQVSRGTRKPAHMVLQRNAESHRAESQSQVRGADPSDRMKVEVPKEHQGITDDGKFTDFSEWTKSCKHLPTYVRH